MTPDLDLARANRQMIAERQTLLAERDLLRKVVSDRSAMIAVECVEGLEVLIARALTGDQGASQVLSQLIERLDRIRSGLSRIALPNGSS